MTTNNQGALSSRSDGGSGVEGSQCIGIQKACGHFPPFTTANRFFYGFLILGMGDARLVGASFDARF